MIKTVLILSLLSSPLLAQNLQCFANQAAAAAGDFLNQVGGTTQTEDTVSLTLNDYEWTLTNNEGELELSVTELSSNANNLGAALTDLLSGIGSATQDNTNEINNALQSEDAGVVIQDNGAAVEALSQYSEQLQSNSESISNSLEDSYNQAASTLSKNENGSLDNVNQQIRNAVNSEMTSTESINNLVSEAVNSIPENAVQVTGNTNLSLDNVASSVNSAAENLAENVNSNQVVNSYKNAASSAADTLSSLPNGLASTANNAATNLRTSADSAANNALNNLSNSGINLN